MFQIVMACTAVINLRRRCRLGQQVRPHLDRAQRPVARLRRRALSGRAGRRLAGLRAEPLDVRQLERVVVYYSTEAP